MDCVDDSYLLILCAVLPTEDLPNAAFQHFRHVFIVTQSFTMLDLAVFHSVMQGL